MKDIEATFAGSNPIDLSVRRRSLFRDSQFDSSSELDDDMDTLNYYGPLPVVMKI